MFLFFIILLTFVYAGWKGAPFVPTRKTDVERFLKLADFKPGQKMYDLGCGDGRLVYATAKQGVKSQGFELSLFPFILAKISGLFQKNTNFKICYGDFWHADLSDADVVYFFLMPKVYPKLADKLKKNLKVERGLLSMFGRLQVGYLYL